MASELIITSDAADDLSDIISYYLEAGQSVASHFIEAFAHTTDLLSEYPQVGTLTRSSIRRRLISGYPYSIYYRITSPGRLELLAILHFRRNPKLLSERFES